MGLEFLEKPRGKSGRCREAMLESLDQSHQTRTKHLAPSWNWIWGARRPR